MQPIIAALLAAAGPALEQALSKLLQSPEFKAIFDKLWANLLAKIAAGVHPEVATKQIQGQILAAASLHLTGNFGADLSEFLAAHKPPTGTPTPPPVTPPTNFGPVTPTTNFTS